VRIRKESEKKGTLVTALIEGKKEEKRTSLDNKIPREKKGILQEG